MRPISPIRPAPVANPDPLQALTRRHFFGRGCALGLGALGLARLLRGGDLAAATTAGAAPSAAAAKPLAPRAPHYAPRAKRVIYLFMAGGPSQLELFDHKPKLAALGGAPPPPSLLEGKRFAFLKGNEKLLAPTRSFGRYG